MRKSRRKTTHIPGSGSSPHARQRRLQILRSMHLLVRREQRRTDQRDQFRDVGAVSNAHIARSPSCANSPHPSHTAAHAHSVRRFRRGLGWQAPRPFCDVHRFAARAEPALVMLTPLRGVTRGRGCLSLPQSQARPGQSGSLQRKSGSCDVRRRPHRRRPAAPRS